MQGFNKLKQISDGINLSVTRPNAGSATRWGGVIDVFVWISVYEMGLRTYTEPTGCALSDDDSTYSKHKMDDEEYLIAYQLAAICVPLQVCLPVYLACQLCLHTYQLLLIPGPDYVPSGCTDSP